MKISYQREMKHNYLIAEPEECLLDGYETRMLAGNHIEGLLKFRIRQLDSKTYYYYDITSRQPLDRMFEHRGMSLDEIRALILGIARTLDRMEEYLLNENQVLLTPEYIYVEPENFAPSFCLVPGGDFDFSKELSSLLQYLLGKVDHQNKEAVVVAYGLFQESQKENYGIRDLLKLLNTAAEQGEATMVKDTNTEMGGGFPDTLYSGEEVLFQDGRQTDGELIFSGSRRQEKGIVPSDSQSQDGTVGKASELISREVLAVIVAVIILGGPALIWFLYGSDGIFQWKFWLLGADLLAIAAICLWREMARRGDLTTQTEEHTGQEWRISFEQEMGKEEEEEKTKPTLPDPGGNTILLKDLDEPSNGRRLVSLDKQNCDIPIPYYPFIIGKQGDITDYVLDRGTVSRLHLRIDNQDGDYQFTDLNTTNGTKVNGRMLNANETVSVKPGCEVYIADAGYLFL